MIFLVNECDEDETLSSFENLRLYIIFCYICDRCSNLNSVLMKVSGKVGLLVQI